QAERDLAHARNDLVAGFYEWACFSAQQASENAIKAIFQRLGAEAWGHSVADLLDALNPRFAVPEQLSRAAFELDRAYIGARYPDAHPSGAPGSRYSREDAVLQVDHAERIVRFCADILAGLQP